MKNHDEPRGSEQGYSVDTAQVNRLANNLAEFLKDFLRTVDDFASRSQTARLKMLTELKSLLDPMPARDRGLLTSMIFVALKEIFEKGGSPEVGVTEGCVGVGGFGVNITEGNTTVGICVAGSFDSGPTGGGIEAKHRY